MVEKDEIKKLMLFASKIDKKNIQKKLKTIKDPFEKRDILKYYIKSKLNLQADHYKKEIDLLKDKNRDVFFAETKMSLLRSKIRLFDATFHKHDFLNVQRLIKEVENEIKNV